MHLDRAKEGQLSKARHATPCLTNLWLPTPTQWPKRYVTATWPPGGRRGQGKTPPSSPSPQPLRSLWSWMRCCFPRRGRHRRGFARNTSRDGSFRGTGTRWSPPQRGRHGRGPHPRPRRLLDLQWLAHGIGEEVRKSPHRGGGRHRWNTGPQKTVRPLSTPPDGGLEATATMQDGASSIKKGGFGIRDLVVLYPAAFLACSSRLAHHPRRSMAPRQHDAQPELFVQLV